MQTFKAVWLDFENEVKEKGKQSALVTYPEVAELATRSGLFDGQEILEAIRFLNDLGSLQYFEHISLKDRVIINPQVCF